MVRGSWGPQVTEVTKKIYLDSSLTKNGGRIKIRLAVALTKMWEVHLKARGSVMSINARSVYEVQWAKRVQRLHACSSVWLSGCSQCQSDTHTHHSQSEGGQAGLPLEDARDAQGLSHQLNLQMRELSQTKYVKIWEWQMCEGAVVRFTWCNVNGEAMRRPGLTGGQSLGLRMKEG